MYRILILSLFGFILMSCSSAHRNDVFIHSPDMVMNKTWQWVATVTPVEQIEAMQPERYTIFLNSNGKLQARFDCNRGGGNYRMSEGKLSFGPLMSTRMACSAESQDAIFMKYLQRVKSFFIRNNNLYLELPFDSGTMRFRLGPEEGK